MTILRINDVRHTTGYKAQASIYNAVRDGTFTKPVRIGARAVGWPVEEVQAIIAARTAGHGKEELQALVAILHRKRATHYQEVVERLGHTPGEVSQRGATARCNGRFTKVKG